MVEALGAAVLKLVRVKIGPITIGRLPIGKWRLLTRAEVDSLARFRLPANERRSVTRHSELRN
jgi:16S rRNA U516 pseudouridylate synthase RsuA-like enzyme